MQTATPTEVVGGLAAQFGGEVPGLTVIRPSLEDVYLELIEQTGDCKPDRDVRGAGRRRADSPPWCRPDRPGQGPLEVRAFFRERQTVVFVFALPAILLVLLGSISGMTPHSAASL